MKLKVIAPDNTLFIGNAKSLNIAERFGSFTILSDHAPFITVLKDFVSTIQTEKDDLTYIAANFGALEVLNNEVSVMIDFGVLGTSKEDALENLTNLKQEISAQSDNLGDDTIANLEIELVRRIREMRR